MLNKVYLVGAVVFMLVFGMTISTTISNPSTSNLIISGVFLVLSLGSFFLNVKVNKSESKEDSDGFTPAAE